METGIPRCVKFYEIDNALIEAIEAGDKPVRVRIDIDFAGDGSFESVFEQDILEADFYGLKEAAGGTSARGEVLLHNPQEIYSYTGAGLKNRPFGRGRLRRCLPIR